MASIICVDPSVSYSALITQLAADSQLDTKICNDWHKGLDYLHGAEPY